LRRKQLELEEETLTRLDTALQEEIHGKPPKKGPVLKREPHIIKRRTKGKFAQELQDEAVLLSHPPAQKKTSKEEGVFYAWEGDQAVEMRKYLAKANPMYFRTVQRREQRELAGLQGRRAAKIQLLRVTGSVFFKKEAQARERLEQRLLAQSQTWASTVTSTPMKSPGNSPTGPVLAAAASPTSVSAAKSQFMTMEV